jgi:hypothetical protein
MRKLVVFGFVVVAIAAVIGCGGGSEETVTETVSADTTAEETTEAESNLVPVEVLSPKGVERCLEQGDATVVTSESLNPGEPIDAHGVFAVGPKSGARIGIVLTLKPFITRRLSRELAEEGTYDISVTPSEEAIVVLDGKATVEDETLASLCSEP